VVCTLTGHGLKDPERAIEEVRAPQPVPATVAAVAAELALGG
jgi:threonine synthase